MDERPISTAARDLDRAAARTGGSTPGELAACVRNVGLVRRAELRAVSASGPADALEAVTAHLIGHALAVGGSAQVAATWWCRPDVATLLLAGRPADLRRSVALLQTLSRRRPGPVVETEPAPREAIGVVGRRAAALLRDLGLYGPVGDPRTAPPCRPVALAGVPTVWLLESDVSALCFVDPAHAAAVEARIARAGRPLGLARVGHDALVQYQLVVRRAGRLRRGPSDPRRV